MTRSKSCTAEAIVGGKNQIHAIDQEKHIKCELALKLGGTITSIQLFLWDLKV